MRLSARRAALLCRFLAVEEAAKAEAFHFRRDRERFIVARGLLRLILGSYLGCDPGELSFRYGLQGKPHLAGEQGCTGGVEIRFNLSHSGGLALLAFTQGANVGVDIERIRANVAYERIADGFFSPEEAAGLCTVPGESMRRRAFFSCWTRKEAYIKAVGAGLSYSLDRFAVSFVPGKPAALLHVDGNQHAASRWLLADLDVGPGYAAALAVKARDRRIRCFQCADQETEPDWRWDSAP